MNFKQKLMAFTALLGVWLFHPATAGAQSADAQKIEKLERQTEMLQRQLKEIQQELARTRKQTERVEAKVEAAPARYSAPPPMATKGPLPPPPPERVKVTLGGFVAAETVWRQHNMVNDIGTAFATTPYPFSPLYNEHEFHGTARQSRISLLVEGNIDPYQKLSGFYESDFLGVGNTSNYNQSNSWAPRLRHAYFTYDNTGWGGWGFHILAGQTWSLATQNQVDMTPRKENIPLTIDANYVVGFNYIRQWQIRGVVDVAPGIALGVSAENPAAIFVGSTATAPLGTGGAFASGGIVNGQVVNFVNTGGGGDFLQNVNVTTDQAPDIIEKTARRSVRFRVSRFAPWRRSAITYVTSSGRITSGSARRRLPALISLRSWTANSPRSRGAGGKRFSLRNASPTAESRFSISCGRCARWTSRIQVTRNTRRASASRSSSAGPRCWPISKAGTPRCPGPTSRSTTRSMTRVRFCLPVRPVTRRS